LRRTGLSITRLCRLAQGGAVVHVNVVPEVIALVAETYVVQLRGSVLLAGQARGWIKQAGRWRAARLDAGDDIRVVVRRADSEGSSGTPFEVMLSWKEERPGRGEALWRQRFWVRDTAEGPVLDKV